MEKRRLISYREQPSMLTFGFLDGNGDCSSPEAIALTLAIVNRKNVVTKPWCNAYMLGDVGVPAPSNPHMQHGDRVLTARIKGIRFEKVHNGERVWFETFVDTEDSTYQVWNRTNAVSPMMHKMIDQANRMHWKFEDYAYYFDDINSSYPDVEITE